MAAAKAKSVELVTPPAAEPSSPVAAPAQAQDVKVTVVTSGGAKPRAAPSAASPAGGGEKTAEQQARADAKAEASAASARRKAIAIAWAINVSFVANVLLFAIKVYATSLVLSLAVIASTVDSFLDLLSGAVIFVSAYFAARRNPYRFPVGKARYEPLSVIVFASVMGMASLQIISQAVQGLVEGIASDGAYEPVPPATIAVLCCVIGLKLALLAVCYQLRRDSSAVGALAMDHFADVATNTLTLIAVLLAERFPSVWWLDPLAAILLALWMLYVWIDAGKEQIGLLAGQGASPRELSEVAFLALTHHPAVLAVDTVLGYQVGNRLQVECDIVVPKGMPLPDAHDVGEALQRKIEALPNVERAFVHLDTEFDHARDDEHANVYELV
jgi:cation diffusion facilitator family transporter